MTFQRDTASRLALRLTMRGIAATLAVVALLFSAGTAWADYADGLGAYKRGDYATALQEWLPLAYEGHAGAQSDLGFMHSNGYGVPQNDAEALKWWRKAAEQGHAMAQYNLGVMYDEGTGVPQNYAEAVKWYRKAAEQGDASAQNNLGFMYSAGKGVPQNDVEALKWYSLAKAQGGSNFASDNMDIVQKRMNSAQIAKAQALASEWWEKHNN